MTEEAINVETQPNNEAKKENKSMNMDQEMNKTIQAMMTKCEQDRLLALDAECRGAEFYESFIDNLDCSAKMKRVLRKIARKTADIGGRVIRIGKIALDFAIKVLSEVRRRFPNVAHAALLVLILHVMISCIPLVGHYLALLLDPLLVVAIVGAGVVRDVLNMVCPIADRHFHASPALAR